MTSLESAPCLRQFCLIGAYASFDITDTSDFTPLFHSHLLLLKLRYAEKLIPLLMITPPTLEKLDLGGDHDDLSPLPFIPSPFLQTFTFDASTPTVSLRWIQHMEHLTTLELSSPEWLQKHAFIRVLNRAHQPQFLPKLHSLSLLRCEFEEVTESLLEALHSTGAVDEGLAVLQRFRLQWPYISDEGPDTLNGRCSSIRTDELEKLVARGMEIYVRTEITSRSSSARFRLNPFHTAYDQL
jgi:hypothetical protein